MSNDAAKKFGDQLKHLRKEQKMSIRGLASKSGVDSGSLTRMEHGKVGSPQPETLKRLAEAFSIPLADLFAMAGYLTPQDLPSLSYYLSAKYGHLPGEAREQIELTVRQHIDEHHAQEAARNQPEE